MKKTIVATKRNGKGEVLATIELGNVIMNEGAEGHLYISFRKGEELRRLRDRIAAERGIYCKSQQYWTMDTTDGYTDYEGHRTDTIVSFRKVDA